MLINQVGEGGGGGDPQLQQQRNLGQSVCLCTYKSGIWYLGSIKASEFCFSCLQLRRSFERVEYIWWDYFACSLVSNLNSIRLLLTWRDAFHSCSWSSSWTWPINKSISLLIARLRQQDERLDHFPRNECYLKDTEMQSRFNTWIFNILFFPIAGHFLGAWTVPHLLHLSGGSLFVFF